MGAPQGVECCCFNLRAAGSEAAVEGSSYISFILCDRVASSRFCCEGGSCDRGWLLPIDLGCCWCMVIALDSLNLDSCSSFVVVHFFVNWERWERSGTPGTSVGNKL